VSYHFYNCSSVGLTIMSRQLSIQKVRRSLFAIVMLASIAWQTVLLYAEDAGTQQPILLLTSPDQVQYHYDLKVGECRNAAGEKGTNGRLLAPCGELAGANLKEIDLRGKDLTGAGLRGADLAGVRLEGAILTGADLTEANLADANLSDADLNGATLGDAKLLNTVLDKTDFSGADLRGAVLHHLDLRTTRQLLSKAKLFKVNLSGADLRQVTLRGRISHGRN
jgi:hypothetical protein